MVGPETPAHQPQPFGHILDLASQRNRFLAFAFAASDLLIECSTEGRILFAAGAAERCLGAAPEDLEGEDLYALFVDADQGLLRRALRTLKDGQRFGPLNLTARASSQSVAVSGCRMLGNDGIVHLTFSRGAPLMRSGDARDEETGLADQSALAQAISEGLSDVRHAGDGAQLSLFSIPDLDDFSSRAGQGGVRAFLAEAGALLRAQAIFDAAARVADDRFTLLHGKGVDAAAVADEISAIARMLDPQGRGVSPEHGTITIDSHLNDNDAAQALIHTISSFARAATGVQSVHSLNEAMDARMRESMARLSSLKREILCKAMRFVAQPVVELATGHVRHHELLSRFGTGRSPHDEVTFAESVGLIFDLDDAVIARAYAYLQAPTPGGPQSLAVNLSGRSLLHAPLIDALLSRSAANRHLRERVLLEITESHAINDLAAANAQIARLRAAGHKVGLDDFGAGAASFQYLKALDIDFVKIDGAYVRRMTDSAREQAMLRSISALARELSITLIAEHVETRAQANLLAGMGVGLGQGFLFGHALPLPEPRDV